MFVPRKILEDKLKRLLADDVGQGDVTTAAVIPPNLIVTAEVKAKDDGVVAGIEEAVIIAESLGLTVQAKVADGQAIHQKQVLMILEGDAQTVLSVERTLLNLLSRMSGIASATRVINDKLRAAGAKTKVAATRKSAPGLLYFDKKAVLLGGGDPHRLHLDDMILIKDNHIAIVGSPETAVNKAKANSSFTKKIEVEITKVSDLLSVVRAGADLVLLDNFSVDQVAEAVGLLEKSGLRNRIILEASGGITDENIVDYALAKVDIISLGALTHSVKALDISLEVVSKKSR